jgi:hypothetical protein
MREKVGSKKLVFYWPGSSLLTDGLPQASGKRHSAFGICLLGNFAHETKLSGLG